MEAHLEINDLWEAVEEDYKVLSLPTNPTIVQMKINKEKLSWKSKAQEFVIASIEIFLRIMTKKITFEEWNFLKKEYEGDERIKGVKILNLIREF